MMSDQVLPNSPHCSYSSVSSSPCLSPSKSEGEDIESRLNFSYTKQTARKSTNNMFTKFLELDKNEKEVKKLKINKTKQTARKLTTPYFEAKVKKQPKHEVITGNDFFHQLLNITLKLNFKRN